MLPQFPPRINLAQLPTPLRPLDRVSESLGGPRIWLKCDDLTGSVLSGNKIRKLEFVTAEAIGNGADTLITCGGLQSNHCRATALVGAQLGLKVHLILRGNPAVRDWDGNLLLDRLAGAEVSIYTPKEYSSRLPDLFGYWENYYRVQGRRPHLIPTGASDATGLWGYINASYEMAENFKLQNINPEWVVCATGSGGTQAGLSLGFAMQGSAARVLGMAVCDSEKYFWEKAQKDIADWEKRYSIRASDLPAFRENVAINTNDCYIGPGYAQGYPEVYKTIKWLAETEGVVLDPVYTAKAFHGLISEIQLGNFSQTKDIVFVHTGGVYGLFPYRRDFNLDS